MNTDPSYCFIYVVLTVHVVVLGDAEVSQHQNITSNSEQLDAVNNNAALKPSSNKFSDAQNNNIGSKSSTRGRSVNSSTHQEPMPAGQNSAGDGGIQIMPYTDFVRNRMAHGLRPPQGVVVRRNGRHVLVPQYVVQHHRQHRAHVRNLRRHGYESEDGRVAGRQHNGSDQYHVNASRHHHRHAAAGHGYESDIGYRSDVAGYNSSRSGPHHNAVCPNVSVCSSDFASRDWRYGSDHDVNRQKVSSSSSLLSRASRNIPLYERDVQETIAEEVADCEGHARQQNEILQRQEWPRAVQVPAGSQFGTDFSAIYPYEAERRRNKSTRHRRNFEPIEL